MSSDVRARDVDAGDVARRLHGALLPLVDGLVATHRPEDVGWFVTALRFLLQPANGLMQIVLEGDTQDRAVVLAAGRISSMPNAAIIERALEDSLGGVLAGLGETYAEKTIARAARARRGGLVVEVTPSSGGVRVLECPEGETLDHGDVLGGIAPAYPETRH